MTNTPDTLWNSLAKAQSNFTAVLRKKTGQIGNRTYNYAELSDIIEMAVPILNKEGIFFTQYFKRRDGNTWLISRVQGHGEFFEDDGLLIPDAMGDQELGKTITYKRRYSLSALLGIATEEDTDGNPVAKVEPNKTAKPEPKPSPAKPKETPKAEAPKAEVKPNNPAINDNDVPNNIGDKPSPEDRKKFIEELKKLADITGRDKMKAFIQNKFDTDNPSNLTALQWKELLQVLNEANSAGKLKEFVNAV